MKSANYAFEWSTANELERIIEPLANFICAADQPRAALQSALAFLVREVDATNKAAITHFRAVLER